MNYHHSGHCYSCNQHTEELPFLCFAGGAYPISDLEVGTKPPAVESAVQTTPPISSEATIPASPFSPVATSQCSDNQSHNGHATYRVGTYDGNGIGSYRGEKEGNDRYHQHSDKCLPYGMNHSTESKECEDCKRATATPITILLIEIS